MRLKEIKPGMVIHCKNDEEKKALLEEAERIGYKWSNTCVPTDCSMFKNSGTTIHFYGKTVWMDFMNITWSDNTDGVTEFSDLILPELTAEEVLQIVKKLEFEFVREYLGLPYGKSIDGMLFDSEPRKIIDMCEKWKSDHEKKEPKIETVDICRIIEIQPDGRKRCVHEEDLASGSTDAEIKIMVEAELKRYCMEHDGEFIAVHEVVSRVKK